MKPYQHEVKYYECDRMGVTHHSNYIRFMEEARVDWMDQLGYGFERMEAEGIVSPVVALSCNYKRTTTFKDVIEIEVCSSSRSLEQEATVTVDGDEVMALSVGDKVIVSKAAPEIPVVMLSDISFWERVRGKL